MFNQHCRIIIQNNTSKDIDDIRVTDNQKDFNILRGPNYFFHGRSIRSQESLTKDLKLSRGRDGRFTMRLFYEDKKVDEFSINLRYAIKVKNPNFDSELSRSHDILFSRDKIDSVYVLKIVVKQNNRNKNSVRVFLKNLTDFIQILIKKV
jgi:hypothetical protein